MTGWLVPLADLDYGPEEEQAVLSVMRSRWLTMGSVTQEFEAAFAGLTGAPYAYAVANATVALHLACSALELGPGDEVIVPALTFVATANAVLYTGATVRFADVCGPHDFTIAPASIEAAITPNTRAIIVMHYAGYPCRMQDILAIANRHRLAVIEDAAHAPGASLDGRPLGTWGDVGCFSFFSNKNLATGEGGMLITSNPALAEKIRLRRSHGMTSLTYDRHQGHAFSYDVVDLGFNYRLDELHAALGLAQIARLAAGNARRRELTRRYREALASLPLDMPFEAPPGDSTSSVLPSCHIFPVLLPQGADRVAFMRALRDERIQSSIHYPPIHRFSYYRSRFGEISLPVTEDIAAREVTLPLYPGMTLQSQDLVIDAVRRAISA